MEVTINIPDEMFQEIIENSEKRSGLNFPNFKEGFKGIHHWNLNIPMNEEDKKLYLWLAAITFNDILNKLQ